MAIVAAAAVLAAAVAVTLPLNITSETGVAKEGMYLIGNATHWDPTFNVSLPAGANVTLVAAHYETTGNFKMNITIGWCLRGFGICDPAPQPPPVVYEATDVSFGSFGWECGNPWSCTGLAWEIVTNSSGNQTWSLSWDLVYDYTVLVPYLSGYEGYTLVGVIMAGVATVTAVMLISWVRGTQPAPSPPAPARPPSRP